MRIIDRGLVEVKQVLQWVIEVDGPIKAAAYEKEINAIGTGLYGSPHQGLF